MSIVRGPRPDSNFYLLNKSISEDRRLGWASRGMLVYLLGKPDNWQISIQALINETQDSGSKTGRDTVYKLLAELEGAGYISRVQQKLPGGKFAPVDYVVSEIPGPSHSLSEKPLTALPHTENTEAVSSSPLPALPHTAPPYTAKPTLVSTEVKQGLNRTIPPNPQGGDPGTDTASRKAKRKAGVSLQTFVADCKAKGEKAMSGYVPVLDYAEKTGIGMDLLGLCWDEFKRRHLPNGTSEDKRYTNWRKAFLNCVQGNWYGLWYVDGGTGEYKLTTKGVQAERATKEAA